MMYYIISRLYQQIGRSTRTTQIIKVMYLSRFQIKQLREEKNMTQAKLAEIINIRQESLSRIELGRINPSIATLEKISDVLEVPISRLFKKK